MPAPANRAKQRFGRLVALEPTAERRGGKVVWRCRCDCGREVLVASHHLRNDAHGQKSCGCLMRETSARLMAVARAGASKATVACAYCGQLASGTTRLVYCSHRCASYARRARSRHAEAARLGRAPCAVCGKPTGAKRRGQKYCSEACNFRAALHRRNTAALMETAAKLEGQSGE